MATPPATAPATKATAKVNSATPAKKKEARVKATKQPSAERPTNAQIKVLHARLQKVTTPEQRKAIYDDCGFHPVALARWFRMLDLKTIGAAAAKPKRGPGRPRKQADATQASHDTVRASKGSAKAKGFTLVSGLSISARETAIELLRALLAE